MLQCSDHFFLHLSICVITFLCLLSIVTIPKACFLLLQKFVVIFYKSKNQHASICLQMIPHCVATSNVFCAMIFYGSTSHAQQQLRPRICFSVLVIQKINSEKRLRFRQFIWEVIARSTVGRVEKVR